MRVISARIGTIESKSAGLKAARDATADIMSGCASGTWTWLVSDKNWPDGSLRAIPAGWFTASSRSETRCAHPVGRRPRPITPELLCCPSGYQGVQFATTPIINLVASEVAAGLVMPCHHAANGCTVEIEIEKELPHKRECG